MLTRREAIGIGLGLATPAWAFASKEFWNDKPPSDWTASEVQDLLNRSPWAREASVSFNGGPGGAGSRRGGGYGGGGYGGIGGIGGGIPGLGGPVGGRRGGGGYPGGSPTGGPPIGGDQFRAIVRWESALPVREALRAKPSGDPEKDYILAVIGDLPSMGRRASDEDDAALDDRRLDNLKQYTKLDRKGDPIFLSRIEATPNGYAGGIGTLFYFSRGESIVMNDKQVTFVTKMGPYEVKTRFTLKEMLYHGKLEL